MTPVIAIGKRHRMRWATYRSPRRPRSHRAAARGRRARPCRTTQPCRGAARRTGRSATRRRDSPHLAGRGDPGRTGSAARPGAGAAIDPRLHGLRRACRDLDEGDRAQRGPGRPWLGPRSTTSSRSPSSSARRDPTSGCGTLRTTSPAIPCWPTGAHATCRSTRWPPIRYDRVPLRKTDSG